MALIKDIFTSAGERDIYTGIHFFQDSLVLAYTWKMHSYTCAHVGKTSSLLYDTIRPYPSLLVFLFSPGTHTFFCPFFAKAIEWIS